MMKIEIVPAETLRPSGRTKYGDVYAQIDKLPPGQAAKITFDTAEEAGRFKNACQTRFPREQWETARQDLTVSVWRRVPVDAPAPAPSL